MSEQSRNSVPGRLPLPDAPNLDWLRKQAKRRLEALRESNPDAQLADAQFDVARQYGFASWRALKAHVDSLTVEGQLFEAAKHGDVETLGKLLDEHPEKLEARAKPYEWSLLHTAAHNGHLAAVDLLLKRGLDVNTRERGDNTYAMHWAAAAGHVEVVKRLADGGGDVVGHGDDHDLEVIGWATCWPGANDDAHRAVVDVLVRHGARHHIFSAIAMDLADEVRRIVGADAAMLNRRQSRNEGNRPALHFAVHMNRPRMVALLLELGADPLAVDASGVPAAAYATKPEVDRKIMEKLHAITAAELQSADRGHRAPHVEALDVVAALALHDWAMAERLTSASPDVIANGGVLHLMAKRNDVAAVRWLLDRGADPSARWDHWDASLTALHLAASQGHVEIVRLLLAAGADATIRDSKHDGDPLGWAEFFRQPAAVELLRAHQVKT